MKKIYEAVGNEKEDIINVDNELKAFDKGRINDVEIEDLLMITRLKAIPKNLIVNNIWSLNGIETQQKNGDILVFEPLDEHIDNNLSNIGINNTKFNSPIKLSDKAIILMPEEKYIKLAKHLITRRSLRNMPIRLYEGREDLAIKMLMHDKGYVYLNLDKDKYLIDEKNHPDIIEYTNKLSDTIKKINEQVKSNNIGAIYNKKSKRTENVNANEKNQADNYKMITGLTKKVEGDISLDDECMASTDIGKRRENQEDAVLLIKNKENPEFKMMVVADGMGGHSNGEIASNAIIKEMKRWFESLTREQRLCYYTSVNELRKDLLKEIKSNVQSAVERETIQKGGSTLVCAIIGKNDTIIANVGDSRAYIIKNGKLIQLSREDTVTQKYFINGKLPDKEASRFDQKSNILVQSIGMNRDDLKEPYTCLIENSKYDLLLLFSDGVTDCLSDDDIVAVCKKSNRSEIAKKIVKKAIKHDSIVPEEYINYTELNTYIPGGKDNATAAVYVPRKEGEDLIK